MVFIIMWALCLLGSIIGIYIDQFVMASVYNAAMLIMIGLKKF